MAHHFRRISVLLLLLSLFALGTFVEVGIPHTHAQLTNSLLQKDTSSTESSISCLNLKKQMETSSLAGNYLGKKIVCGSMTLADIPHYIRLVLEFFFNMVGSLAVIAIMWSGVQYMKSKDKEAADARKHLRSAIVGLIVFFSSFAIVRILTFIFTTN